MDGEYLALSGGITSQILRAESSEKIALVFHVLTVFSINERFHLGHHAVCKSASSCGSSAEEKFL